tara:strand:+ start:436 stop:1155 length:720 start_codon:yes stop_codon:yes gene_type:complete
MTQRHTQDQVPGNGIGGQLSFSYYITGKDYFKEFITGQGEIPLSGSQQLSGNFGGLYFSSGFLTSYSVNFSPNSPVSASATVSFFDSAGGVFTPTYQAAPSNTQILNMTHATVEGEFATGAVDNFLAGTYNYSSEVSPVYLMNETVPSDVSFGPKTVNVNFSIDNPTGYLPVSGDVAKISVNLKSAGAATLDTFVCSGVMNSRNLASSAGDYIKQTINITQSALSDPEPIIESVVGLTH